MLLKIHLRCIAHLVFRFEVHLLDQHLDNPEAFRSFSFFDAGPSEDFTVLIKKSYRMMSRWLSTRTYETVENKRTALESVQKTGGKVH